MQTCLLCNVINVLIRRVLFVVVEKYVEISVVMLEVDYSKYSLS